MRVFPRSMFASVAFAGLLLCVWLAPSPSQDFEIGGEVAQAGQAKKKSSKAKRPPARTPAAKTPAAMHRHHHHNLHQLRAAARALHVARKHVHAVSANYGNHRHQAGQEIGNALHQVHLLEKDIRAAIR